MGFVLIQAAADYPRALSASVPEHSRGAAKPQRTRWWGRPFWLEEGPKPANDRRRKTPLQVMPYRQMCWFSFQE